MRLPSGYGSVYKLSGKRRKPWIARKTTGWTDEGRQTYLTIGYFATKNEALSALSAYNADPFDLDGSRLTFAEVYDKWKADTFTLETNKSTIKNYELAYKFCRSIYEKQITELKLPHLQQVVNDCHSANQASRIKLLMKKMYEWCIQREYLHRNLAENITLPKYEQQTFRTALEKAHIDLLWQVSETSIAAQIALILVYSGVRINELLSLKKEDLRLSERYFFVRKSKTVSGIRIVPIAEKVAPYWEQLLNKSTCEYVFTNERGNKLTYENYKKRMWEPLMQQLELNYVIHECRHTCNSLLIMANVNPTIRKKIMGHTSHMDIGEAVYGHIYIDELIKAINTI